MTEVSGSSQGKSEESSPHQMDVAVDTNTKESRPSESIKKENNNCQVCTKSVTESLNNNRILSCQKCVGLFHTSCVEPTPGLVIDHKDWLCPTCIQNYGEDFGFEDGKTWTLAEFQKVADGFKEQWFSDKAPRDPETGDLIITEDMVEREFWRLVESPFDDVEVEYGADLHSSHHGSGFPKISESKTKYTTSGWNLNNIALLPKSLFCHIRHDISGMMIPWLYVGMIFSTFCWHTEDHYTYSINYNHWGETKTWYGVPASDAELFERTMKQRVPKLFESNPDLLSHLTTLMSPGYLRRKRVQVFAVDQRAGEFVITFPRSYHAGFNQGFNFAEAVNFALPDWISFGSRCIQRYHRFQKQPVFSHDELVVSTWMRDKSAGTANWLREEFHRMYFREIENRNKLRETYSSLEETQLPPASGTEIDSCVVCKSFCYLSAVQLSCSSDFTVCMEHSQWLLDQCQCPSTHLILKLRLTDSQLSDMANEITSRTDAVLAWKNQYDQLMLRARRPLLDDLVELVEQAHAMRLPQEDVQDLQAFVQNCLSWVTGVRAVLGLPHQEAPTLKRRRHDAGWEPSRKMMRRSSSFSSKSLDGTESTAESLDPIPLLENLEKWLADAESLPFRCNELYLLNDTIQKTHALQVETRATLSSIPLNESNIESLLERFSELNVKTNELALLSIIQEDRQWLTRAKNMLETKKCDYAELDVCISAAKPMSVFGTQTFEGLQQYKKDRASVLSDLKKKKNLADEWKLKYVALVKQKSVSITDLDSVLSITDETPIMREPYQFLLLQRQNVDSWLSKMKTELEWCALDDDDVYTARQSDLKKPVAYIEAQITDLIRLLELPIALQEIAVLRKAMSKVEDWRRSATKAIKSCGVSGSFMQFLSDMHDYVGAFTAEDGEARYCICRAPDGGLMLECDVCHEWYHATCLKMSKKDVEATSNFICPICDESDRFVSVGTSLTLNMLSTFEQEANRLPYVPEEYQSLQTLIDKIIAWKSTCIENRLIEHSSNFEVEYWRKMLRCLEGFPIELNIPTNLIKQKIRHSIIITQPPITTQPSTSA
ncbi:hypothetical protein HDV05_007215 [Chytridiales sp. JEL 0842]|nr:hypothetical protein HDV05_007215 [Chytridiales sp. JEL 0842]